MRNRTAASTPRFIVIVMLAELRVRMMRVTEWKRDRVILVYCVRGIGSSDACGVVDTLSDIGWAARIELATNARQARRRVKHN